MGRLADLVIVIVVVALGGWLLSRSSTAGNPTTDRSPAPAASSASNARLAPPFTLDDVDGKSFHYAGEGPALFILTAVGCRECLSRASVDAQAVARARERGLRTCNLAVYASLAETRAYRDRQRPTTDVVLADPGGKVGVDLYHGNDGAVWIVIDSRGRITWQGPGDLAALRTQLGQL